MLQELFTRGTLVKSLKNHRRHMFFAPASNRKTWKKIGVGQAQARWRELIIRRAAKLTGKSWPELTARQIMAYIRDGSRATYETPYFARRNNLGALVLAECLEYRGHYLDDIIDGLWHILSEPDWVIHAHSEYLPNDPLPKPYVPRVDLFSAITGMTLAETVQLLGAELEKISPALMERIRAEVITRIIVPMEEHPHRQWWLSGRNNWTPWCSSNVLGCALTFLNDPVREAKLIDTLLTANDRFIACYRPDGGCDEGPMYWAVASGKLLIMLDMLDQVTDGKVKPIFQTPLLRNMGDYVVNVQLCRDWFLSPADSCARIKHMNPGPLYRFGFHTGSRALQDLAISAAYGFNPRARQAIDLISPYYCGNFLTFMLRNLFWLPGKTEYKQPAHPPSMLLPDLQISIVRENPETADHGLILTLKGGNNAENHNHNDLGQFELFRDGHPVIIDVGTAYYGRQNFSDKRYELWYVGAQGHNIPVINGIGQEAGEQYKAGIGKTSSAGMELDLSAAYPPNTGLKTYTRTSMLNSLDGSATIADRMTIKKGLLRIAMPLYTAIRPEIINSGLVCWSMPSGKLEMTVSGLRAEKIENIAIEDKQHRKSWGKQIYLIRLTGEFPDGKGQWQLHFR